MYVVTNTGNSSLFDVTVTDDRVDASAIDCGDGTNKVPGPLGPDESVTCTAQGVARPGQYENLGTVTAQSPTADVEGGTTSITVTDTDPSHYHGETDVVEPAAHDTPPTPRPFTNTVRTLVNSRVPSADSSRP